MVPVNGITSIDRSRSANTDVYLLALSPSAFALLKGWVMIKTDKQLSSLRQILVDTDEVSTGALTSGVVLPASSVEVATCAKTRVTIAGANKHTAAVTTTIAITITGIPSLCIRSSYD